MKAGKDIVEMAAELKARQARKRDLVIDSREISVLTSEEGGTEVALRPGGNTVAELVPQHLFMRQLGQHIGVRADLMDRLQGEHPTQFDQLVNGLLGRVHLERDKPQRHLIRTYLGEDGGPGVGRALLGDGYRTIDNEDIAESVFPVILDEMPGAHIQTCELTDTKMYIKVLFPGTSCDLRDLIKPGGHHIYDAKDPDTVFGGFVLTNSEVGAAALSIEHMLYRVRCSNGWIEGKAMQRRHVGKRAVVGEDYGIYSDETRQQDDKALMMKVADAVRHTVSEEKVRQLAQQLADTMSTEPIEHPIEAMKILAPKVGLTDREGGSVLEQLLAEKDRTLFGVTNAITAAAQNVESYDRSVEMEKIGADVMAMSTSDWQELVAA